MKSQCLLLWASLSLSFRYESSHEKAEQDGHQYDDDAVLTFARSLIHITVRFEVRDELLLRPDQSLKFFDAVVFASDQLFASVEFGTAVLTFDQFIGIEVTDFNVIRETGDRHHLCAPELCVLTLDPEP